MDKSVISQLSLFLKGSDAYAEMFEPLSNNVTDENTNTSSMQVKEIYTRPISDKLILPSLSLSIPMMSASR